jgi:dipeptidyl aminopeptidase/acylaminoacyl peptidase
LSNITSTLIKYFMIMKRNIEKPRVNAVRRLVAVTLMLSLIAPVMINAQAGKANFAGEWTLNAEKSTQPQGGQGGGGGMRMGGGNFVATQEANLLIVVRTRTGQDGQPSTITMKYTLDGKESVNTSPRGDSKSVATWSPDGKSLTIETTRTMDMNGESRTMKSVEVWKLTDAKTLAVTSTRQGPDGDVKSNMVYEKK